MIDDLVNRLEELNAKLKDGATRMEIEAAGVLISAWEALLSRSDRAGIADVANGLGTLREALAADVINPILVGQNMVGLGDAVEYVAGLPGAPFVLSDVAQKLQSEGARLAQDTVVPGVIPQDPSGETVEDDRMQRTGGVSGDNKPGDDPSRGTVGTNAPPLSNLSRLSGDSVVDTGEGEWRGTP